MKRALSACNHFLLCFEKIVLILSLTLMLASVLIAILSRLLGIDVPWVTPLVLALMIVATFAGAAIATSMRRHITMDLLTKMLSPRTQAAASALTSLLAAMICSVLVTAGIRWVKTNMEFSDPISLALKIPDWYLQAVVPIGFGFCAMHFLINGLSDVSAAIRGLPANATPLEHE